MSKKEKIKKKRQSVVSEFKKFVTRGNIVDMAVGVIIGGAFGKIVSSLVADVIMPPISYLISGSNMNEWKLTLREAVTNTDGEVVKAEIAMRYGVFLQTVIDFLLIAICIFMFVKIVTHLRVKMTKIREAEIERHRTEEEKAKIAAAEEAKRLAEEAAKNAPPAPTAEEILIQIRDLLAAQAQKPDAGQ